jgi:hypothetical protein
VPWRGIASSLHSPLANSASRNDILWVVIASGAKQSLTIVALVSLAWVFQRGPTSGPPVAQYKCRGVLQYAPTNGNLSIVLAVYQSSSNATAYVTHAATGFPWTIAGR